MYDVNSMNSNEFIDDGEVSASLAAGEKVAEDPQEIDRILQKARKFKGLTHREAAALLALDDDESLNQLYAIAREVKETIYGQRIVLFAPLYLSSYCVNNCAYCGYKHSNQIGRHQLS